jgi:hypothetical protein
MKHWATRLPIGTLIALIAVIAPIQAEADLRLYQNQILGTVESVRRNVSTVLAKSGCFTHYDVGNTSHFKVELQVNFVGVGAHANYRIWILPRRTWEFILDSCNVSDPSITLLSTMSPDDSQSPADKWKAANEATIDSLVKSGRYLPAGGGGETHCVDFVRAYAIRKFGSPTAGFVALGGTANQSITSLRNDSSHWKHFTDASDTNAYKQAAAIAGTAPIVLVAWENPDGHGHIAIVRPDDPDYPSGRLRGGSPYVAQAGAKLEAVHNASGSVVCPASSGSDSRFPLSCAFPSSAIGHLEFFVLTP